MHGLVYMSWQNKMSAIYKIINKKKLDIVKRRISKAHGLPNECYTSKDYN